MEQIVFTPAALLELLTQIEELQDVDIGITESADGRITLTVGQSTYNIDVSNATEVEVTEDIVETVEQVNDDTYTELDESGEVSLSDVETVQSGIIKEAIKSLLLGGMIRLSTKLLK